MRLIAGRLLLAALLGWFLATPPARAETIAVAAAISLKDAAADLAKAYKADTGDDVQFAFGSSGQLMAQVKSGAPIDAFISAAAKQVDDLAKDKLVDETTRRVVTRNALVLIVPAAAKSPPATFAELTDARVKRVAVGEPKTVPAGQYAAQSLKAMKLDDKLANRLVYGSNVRQVLDYVVRGEVDAGIVYATDARQAGDKVRVVATAEPSTHEPIVYPAVVVSASAKRDAARRFLDYLASPKAREIWGARGFITAAGDGDDDRRGANPAPRQDK